MAESATDANETELKEQESDGTETEVDGSSPEQDVENQEPSTEVLEERPENQEPEIQTHETELETAELDVEAPEPEIQIAQPEVNASKLEAEIPKLEVETPALTANDATQEVEIPENEKDESEPKENVGEIGPWELVQPEVDEKEEEQVDGPGKETSQEGQGSTYLNLANQSENRAETEVRRRRKSHESDGKKSRKRSVEKCLEESVNHTKRRTIVSVKHDCCVIV